MAKSELKGIAGVLGSLSEESRKESIKPVKIEQPRETAGDEKGATGRGAAVKQQNGEIEKDRNSPRPARSRIGRPPGRKSGEHPLKKKTSLYVSAKLMDEYIDWSWEERCNLGEIVERALQDYRDRYRKSK